MGNGIDFLKSHIPFLSKKDQKMCKIPEQQFVSDKSDIPPGYDLFQDADGRYYYFSDMKDPAGNLICDQDGYPMQEIKYFQDQ